MICREELYSVYFGYRNCIGQGCMSPDLFLRFLASLHEFSRKKYLKIFRGI